MIAVIRTKKRKTAMVPHHFTTGSKFNFEEITILDIENDYYSKRTASEMIHIEQIRTNNFRTDW